MGWNFISHPIQFTMQGKIPISELKRKRRISFYDHLSNKYFNKSRDELLGKELDFLQDNWLHIIITEATKLTSLPTFEAKYKLKIKLIPYDMH